MILYIKGVVCVAKQEMSHNISGNYWLTPNAIAVQIFSPIVKNRRSSEGDLMESV